MHWAWVVHDCEASTRGTSQDIKAAEQHSCLRKTDNKILKAKMMLREDFREGAQRNLGKKQKPAASD